MVDDERVALRTDPHPLEGPAVLTPCRATRSAT